jgi:hypothetical protein
MAGSADRCLTNHQGERMVDMQAAADFPMWTHNRNHGGSDATGPNGKIVAFFGEPQVWFNLNNTFSVGSKINLYYHVLTNNDSFQIYPTVAIRCKL